MREHDTRLIRNEVAQASNQGGRLWQLMSCWRSSPTRAGALRLLDVFGPFGVPVDRVDGKPHQLHAALVEFRLQLCESTKLRCAHWREVLRVREQHRPAIADPVMEFDFALSGFGFEIRGCCANRKCHVTTSCHSSCRKIRLNEYSKWKRLGEPCL